MVCKSCGTKLIRGHAFCMNCGTPVPPGMGDDDDGMTPANDLFANGNGNNDTEGGSDEGTLVFCPACGMHMQKDPYRCEKCGMIIRENIHSDNPQSVPAFNPDVGIGELNGGIGGFGIGGGIESIGGMAGVGGSIGSIGGGMASIGGGMGSIGGGMASVGGSMASIGGSMASVDGNNTAESSAPNMFNTSNNDELSALAGFSVAPGNIMPSIDTPDQPNIIHQKEPEKGQERKMEDFSMSDVGSAGSMMQDNTVPVIEGCSMDEDSSKDVELDPYKFLNNSMGDMLVEEPQAPAAQSALIPEPVAPAAAAAMPEPITMPAPIAVEPVVPTITEPVAPVAEIMPEPIAPPIVEPVAPAAETMPEPIAPPIVEPVAPAAETMPEPIAPPIVEPVAPVAETMPEPIAPPIVEPVAPAAETMPEPIAPPIVEPVAPVAETMSEPIAPPIVEPVAPVAETMSEPIAPPIVEPVAPVAETMSEPIAPPIVEPVAPVAETMPEPISPPIVEPVAPVSETMPEPIAPPIVGPIAPVAETMSEPIAPPIVEPVAPVAETMSEPISPPIVEPAAPVVAPAEPVAAAPVNDFVPEERGFIAESNSLISEIAQTPAQPKTQTSSPTATAVLPDPITESISKAASPLNRPDNSSAGNAPDASKGKLVYCRNCGQDMYDTEKVCKNCGAPYKGAYVPPKNAPSRDKSDEPKKIFGIFAPSVFAGMVVVAIAVIALGIFIGIRLNSPKTPQGGGHTAVISTSSDNQSVDTSSGSVSNSAPVQSTDNTSTNEDPASSDDPGSVPSSSSDINSSSSNMQNQSSHSSATPQSSSAKPQSSIKPQSSSTKPQSTPASTNQVSAKVQSLETDRVKIMNAIARLSGEMGKINIFVRHISYELDHTNITKETTLKNFFNSDLGKAFANSIQGSRVSTNSVVDSAAPANSEMNGLYQSLKNLQRQYIDACNAVLEPTNASKFVDNANGYINAFNSMLTQQLGFNKFMMSAYTSADKDQAYLSVLRLAKSMINESSNGLSTIQSAILRLGESRFDSSIDSVFGGNASAYVDAAAAAGRVNSYRIMLLGVQSSYSGSYSALSSSYSALSNAFTLNSEIQQQTYDQYNTLINQYIASARVGASKISS